MKTNQSRFGPDGARADYENLKSSVGNLPLPGNIVIQNDGTTAGAVRITWQDNSWLENANATDRLRVVYFTGNTPTEKQRHPLLLRDVFVYINSYGLKINPAGTG